MVRAFARKLLGPRAIVLDLRHAGNRGDNIGNGHRRETVSPEKSASFDAEQVQMNAPRVCAALRAAAINAPPIPRRRIDSFTYSERISAASIFDSTPITPTASSPTYAKM
jgi:hypothetical protein